jgi:hypothetical protein
LKLVFFSYLELNINSTLNSRLIPAHMQGQQTVAASVVSSSANTTAANASATGVSTTGTSVTATTSGNEKSLTPTNNSNNTPPPSVAPGAGASTTTTNVNGPGENDGMNSLDEQTATSSGDSINKDRS